MSKLILISFASDFICIRLFSSFSAPKPHFSEAPHLDNSIPFNTKTVFNYEAKCFPATSLVWFFSAFQQAQTVRAPFLLCSVSSGIPSDKAILGIGLRIRLLWPSKANCMQIGFLAFVNVCLLRGERRSVLTEKLTDVENFQMCCLCHKRCRRATEASCVNWHGLCECLARSPPEKLLA